MKTVDSGILAKIPGEYVSMGSQLLPSAESAQADERREAMVAVPFLGRVVIRYRRFTYRHGKSRHYCWVAEGAVKAE